MLRTNRNVVIAVFLTTGVIGPGWAVWTYGTLWGQGAEAVTARLRSPAAEQSPAPAREFREVGDYIAQQVKNGQTSSVAVAVVKNDSIVWAAGFGLANREAGIKATADSIYRLASVSKPITATGLMILVDRGKIDLDAPANRYLPRNKLRAPLGSPDAMTVRRLANHTSGLPVHYHCFYDGHQPPSMDETIARFGFASTEPGTVSEYSNLGFGILGYLTEVVAATPWRSFMEKEVYDPLGMSRTSDRVRPGHEAEAAVPYMKDVADRFVPVDDYGFDHPGASAIWSSAKDLARFARMHLRGGELNGVRVLSERATRAMQVVNSSGRAATGTGIAWMTFKDHGRRCIAHSGSMPGVATSLRLYPDDGIGTVVLLNTLHSDEVVPNIEERLADVLFGKSDTDRRPTGDKPAVDKPTVFPPNLVGTWLGKLAHPDGDIRLKLAIQGPSAARATLGNGWTRDLTDISFRQGRLGGNLHGKLDTHPYYHSPIVKIEFQLDPRGDRLTGVARVLVPRWFSLPYWVDLARSSDDGEKGR